MKNLFLAATVLIANIGNLFPLTATAQSIAMQDNPYGGVIDAILDGNRVASIDQASRIVAEHFIQSDPLVSRTAAENPAMATELAAAIRPALEMQTDRLFAKYRPSFIAVMTDTFSPQQAQEIAGFFSSPLGQRLVSGAISNVSMSESIHTMRQAGAVSRAAINADFRRASERAADQASESDLETLGSLAAANHGLFEDIWKLNPLIVPLRAQMESEPMTAEENAALVEGVARVLARYDLGIRQ